MKNNTELSLMELETRLDRLQNYCRKNDFVRAYPESRKCLGIVRAILEYHKPNRQKTLRHFGFGENWRHSVRDGKKRVLGEK